MPVSTTVIKDAAAIIADGQLVAMPTETVYGLAADATNDQAVAGIFEAKGRPQFNPLIIHVTGVAMASGYVDFSPLAIRLAEAFWPGPLTMVLPRRAESDLSLLVSAGLDTVAVRMPDHPVAQQLIAAVGHPLAAPSANRSGSISPTQADHVHQSLGERVHMILDDGPCVVGLESTIIKVEADEVTMLRPGGVPRALIEAFLGKALLDVQDNSAGVQAPGMLKSHYAPRASLRLNVTTPNDGEAFLAFGKVDASETHVLNLSERGDLREAAANLFAHLRALDETCSANGLSAIAASPIPHEGLGEAINDRLARAAAPRP